MPLPTCSATSDVREPQPVLRASRGWFGSSVLQRLGSARIAWLAARSLRRFLVAGAEVLLEELAGALLALIEEDAVPPWRRDTSRGRSTRRRDELRTSAQAVEISHVPIRTIPFPAGCLLQDSERLEQLDALRRCRLGGLEHLHAIRISLFVYRPRGPVEPGRKSAAELPPFLSMAAVYRDRLRVEEVDGVVRQHVPPTGAARPAPR
jgi:hypothetical protein